MALKLYTVVRHDLTPGAQAAQSAHALAALALQHPYEFKDWDNQTIVLLQTQYISQLHDLIKSADDGGFVYSTFTEPDYEWFGYNDVDPYMKSGVMTAVAFAPDWLVQNVLLADLPLALSGPSRKKGWFS